MSGYVLSSTRPGELDLPDTILLPFPPCLHRTRRLPFLFPLPSARGFPHIFYIPFFLALFRSLFPTEENQPLIDRYAYLFTHIYHIYYIYETQEVEKGVMICV